MKRFSISTPAHSDAKEVKFQYYGRTDNPEEVIEKYKNSPSDRALQITDSQTKKVIFRDIRPVKGYLTVEYKSNYTDVGNYIRTYYFHDLAIMRRWEHWYLYECESAIKVERTIL